MGFPAKEGENFVTIQVHLGLRNSHLLGITDITGIFSKLRISVSYFSFEVFLKKEKLITCYMPIIMWQL